MRLDAFFDKVVIVQPYGRKPLANCRIGESDWQSRTSDQRTCLLGMIQHGSDIKRYVLSRGIADRNLPLPAEAEVVDKGVSIGQDRVPGASKVLLDQKPAFDVLVHRRSPHSDALILRQKHPYSDSL